LLESRIFHVRWARPDEGARGVAAQAAGSARDMAARSFNAQSAAVF